MLTIKYVWFYAVIVAATVGGLGAGIANSPSQGDIENALKQQSEAMAAMDCEKAPENTWKRVAPEKSPSRGF